MADLTDKQAALTSKAVDSNADELAARHAGIEQQPSTGSGPIGRAVTSTIQTTQNLWWANNQNNSHNTNTTTPHIQCIGTTDGTGTIGIRSVKVIWLDENFNGPYEEIIAFPPGGGTPLLASYTPFVATNVCHVLKMEAVSVGSAQVAQNNIAIVNSNSAATSTRVHSRMETGDNFAHNGAYFIRPSQTALIRSITVASQDTASAQGGVLYLTIKDLGGAERNLYGPVAYFANTGSVTINFRTPIKVVGPSRVLGYVTDPSSSNARKYAQIFVVEVSS